MMSKTGSFSFPDHSDNQDGRSSSCEENAAASLYSTLVPSPPRPRIQTLDYDEITEIDHGKFRIADQDRNVPSARIHTTNALYFSHADAKNLAHPTVTLNERYKLSRYRERDRKTCPCPSSKKFAVLFVVFVALTTILLSATSIAACLLIMFGVISPPAMVSATMNVSSSSPTLEQNYSCPCTSELQFLGINDLTILQQQVADLQTEIEKMKLKISTSIMVAEQRMSKLTLQMETTKRTMEHIIPMAQQASQVLDTSGLTLPAHIHIEMNAGCEKTTSSAEIPIYKGLAGAYSINYFDMTSVITDITCELEMSGMPTPYGVGVIEVEPGSASKNGSVLQYFSEADVACRCYYWNPNQKPNHPTGAFCRQVITKCPYKKQPHIDTFVTT